MAIEGEGEEGSKEKKFERKPSHLSPAFDRAAMTKEWIHWGRMYYYDWTDGIKEWSVNPDPMISARGIAKYLINRVIEDTLTVEEANQILERHKYDFGIRRPPGNFTNHPLKGAAGILKYGKYVGKHE